MYQGDLGTQESGRVVLPSWLVDTRCFPKAYIGPLPVEAHWPFAGVKVLREWTWSSWEWGWLLQRCHLIRHPAEMSWLRNLLLLVVRSSP